MRYAFTFDASACTGCKTCQVACKDKNGLPAGVLWRRVYEVSGGAWQRQGAAWTNTVFAYNVSVACNHCDDPACARACPAGAYSVRPDGIVRQDPAKCIGCEYCAWVCPYSAPQYSAALGRTTKCDFCCDLIDQGLPPACVASCPMRALDYRQLADEESIDTRQPFPLPAASPGRPRVEIRPHRAMLNDLPKVVANLEEVRPAARFGRWRVGEAPLVAFTLCGQAAAGAAILSSLTGVAPGALLAAIGVLLFAATLVSLMHLGTVWQAWRAPSQPRTSPLSREIVMLGVFAGSWVFALAAPGLGQITMGLTGAAFVYSMGEVYRTDSVPAWNTWRTHAAFAATTLALGAMVVILSATLAAPGGPGRAPVAVLMAAAVSAIAIAARRRFYAGIGAKTM